MVTLLFPGPIIFFACFYEGQSNELLIRTPPKVSHCDDHTFLTHKNNGVTFVTNKYWDLQFILLFLVNQAGFYNSNNQFDICVTNPSEIGVIGQLSLLWDTTLQEDLLPHAQIQVRSFAGRPLPVSRLHSRGRPWGMAARLVPLKLEKQSELRQLRWGMPHAGGSITSSGPSPLPGDRSRLNSVMAHMVFATTVIQFCRKKNGTWTTRPILNTMQKQLVSTYVHSTIR